MSSDAPARRSSSSTLAAIVSPDGEPPSTEEPTTLEELSRQVRGLRALFELHVKQHEEDRRAANTRSQAITDLLGEILGRLPERPTVV